MMIAMRSKDVSCKSLVDRNCNIPLDPPPLFLDQPISQSTPYLVTPTLEANRRVSCIESDGGGDTLDAARLLTSMTAQMAKEIDTSSKSISIRHIPLFPDFNLIRNDPITTGGSCSRPGSERPAMISSASNPQVTSDLTLSPRSPRVCGVFENKCVRERETEQLQNQLQTSRVRAVSIDSHHPRCSAPPISSKIGAFTEIFMDNFASTNPTRPNNSTEARLLQQLGKASAFVSPPTSPAAHPVNRQDKNFPRDVERKKRHLDFVSHDKDSHVATNVKEVPSKKMKVQVEVSQSPKAKAQKYAPVKKILRKKFSWKNYPELEAFLIANRDEYLRHSALNYTMQQKQYNNRLTERLLELASENGYVFDKEAFNFVTVRDRIRCYFKSYVQSSKKRGLIIGYAARRAGLVTKKDLEKSAGLKGKIVVPAVSKQK